MLEVQRVRSFNALQRACLSMEQWRRLLQLPNLVHLTSLSAILLLNDVAHVRRPPQTPWE